MPAPRARAWDDLLGTRWCLQSNVVAEPVPQALILIREWRRKHRSTDPVVAAFIAKLEADVLASPGPANGMCSMFGVWGSRSEGKKLFTGRNLDWNQNTGINKWVQIGPTPPSRGSLALHSNTHCWTCMHPPVSRYRASCEPGLCSHPPALPCATDP